MQLFNTMTQQIEPFVAQDNRAGLYVCGVTPYDTAHLGHAFVFSTFDNLVRVLRYGGVVVTYVQNVTDIDDPLFEKANALGNITWDELARQETARFVKEMTAIHVNMPEHFVRASDELPAMFTLIEQLIEKGYAYIVDGWIYFAVNKDPHYGQLAAAAGLKGYDNLLATANQNGNDPTDPRKHDPLDFLLWRGAVAGEPSWSSPWGEGRPGWHIECSAMATRYLGPQVDIHGGGSDLIFPHHSSEIAQSENATGVTPYVRHWMHISMVALKGTKMSKSLGNLVIVNQLMQDYSPNAIRILLASHHYRTAWEYFTEQSEQAQLTANRFQIAVRGEVADTIMPATGLTATYTNQCIEALKNDLNTPAAIAELTLLADSLLDERIPAEDAPAARRWLIDLAGLMGIELMHV